MKTAVAEKKSTEVNYKVVLDKQEVQRALCLWLQTYLEGEMIELSVEPGGYGCNYYRTSLVLNEKEVESALIEYAISQDSSLAVMTVANTKVRKTFEGVELSCRKITS